MKKLTVMLLAFCLLFTGCSSKEEVKTDEGKLQVYASFYPMYDFAKKIGGDKVEVKTLIPAGTEPHDWEPSPKDIVKIGDSDVFIYNGVGMEPWLDKVSDTVKNKDLVIVEASKGAKLLKREEEHEEEIDEHEHHHGEYDPHIWLDPENAKIEMNNIKDAFITQDPDNKDYYEENYKENAKKLDELNKEYKDELANVSKREFIVAHEAFGYICNAYDIEQVGIEGLSPDSEPDAAKMAEVSKFAKENNIKYIFFEELVSSKVSETIAKEVGAKTAVLNPIEGLTEDQLKAGEDYFSIMHKNLENLLLALK